MKIKYLIELIANSTVITIIDNYVIYIIIIDADCSNPLPVTFKHFLSTSFLLFNNCRRFHNNTHAAHRICRIN